MSTCCEDKGKLCCFDEPSARECLEARVAELEEALEKVLVYLTKRWGELSRDEDTGKLKQVVQDAIAYEVI